MKTVFFLATFTLAAAGGGTGAAADAPGGVPPARLAKLTRGINLSHWFSQSNDYSRQHLETYDTARDAALIKAMGFRHVRFTFNDATVVDKENPSLLNPEKIGAVRCGHRPAPGRRLGSDRRFPSRRGLQEGRGKE